MQNIQPLVFIFSHVLEPPYDIFYKRKILRHNRDSNLLPSTPRSIGLSTGLLLRLSADLEFNFPSKHSYCGRVHAQHIEIICILRLIQFKYCCTKKVARVRCQTVVVMISVEKTMQMLLKGRMNLSTAHIVNLKGGTLNMLRK